MKVKIGNHSSKNENENTFQGGILTQSLILAHNPTQPMEAATKQYVDDIASTKSNTNHTHILNQISDWPTQISISELIHLDGVTSNIQSQLDSKADSATVNSQLATKVNKAGDTLTGFLTLHADPTSNLHAATKQYVDTNDALKVNKAGDTLTGFLTLHANPTNNLHAATKQYVDTQVATKANIAHTHTLSNISDWPATVDATEVSYLNGLVDNIQFQLDNKVDNSTLLSGLNTKVNKTGDTMSGFLTLHANPTNNLHAATKQYVDAIVPTGSIIGFVTQNTPSGYLRCNGANISKTTYANLFSVIGDTYTKTEPLGYGSPHVIQSQFNENDSLILSNWTINNTLQYATTYYSIEVIKNKIYIIGGFTGSTYYNTLQKITLNNDGTIASVTTHSTTLPQSFAYHSSIVIQNYIYVIGGRLSSGTSLNTVYRAPIDANGEIGTFSLYANLPVNCDSAALLRIKNYLYLFAGRNGTATINTIYRFNIQSNGDITFTSPTTITMPQNTYGHTVTVHKNKVFILGGFNSSNTAQSTTFTADILADGTISSFTSSTALPVAHGFLPILSTKNAFYMVRTNGSNIIYTGNYNLASNTISWLTGTAVNNGLLPSSTAQGTYICSVNNYVYLFALNNTTSIARCYLSGGYNDYSNLIAEYDTTRFGLPDLTYREYEDKVYYYIKI